MTCEYNVIQPVNGHQNVQILLCLVFFKFCIKKKKKRTGTRGCPQSLVTKEISRSPDLSPL